MTDQKRYLLGATDVTGASETKDYFILEKYTAQYSGDMAQFAVKTGVNGSVKCAIYADSGGEPGALITAMNTGQAVSGTGWHYLDFTSTPIVAGTTYWLAFNMSVTGAVQYQVTTDVVLRFKAATYSTFSFPDPAGSGFTSYTTVHELIAGWGVSVLVAGDHYTRDVGNPVITETGGYDACGQCPVIKSGSTYHFYWSKYQSANYSISHGTADAIDGAITPDAANPILTTTGSCGEGHAVLMDPSTHAPITRSEADLGIGASTEQRYWMVYANGSGSGTTINLAYNASLDGDWTKLSAYNPILICSPGEWDALNIGDDSLIFFMDGETYTILYSSYGSTTSPPYNYSMGLATSSSMVNAWTKYGGNPVLTQTPEYPRRVMTGDIWKSDSTWTLVYTDIIMPYIDEIGCKATSTDLINWTRDPNNPIIVPSEEESSTSDWQIFREGGKEWLYFEQGGGSYGTTLGIGRAWITYPPIAEVHKICRVNLTSIAKINKVPIDNIKIFRGTALK